MKPETIAALNEINRKFYETTAEEFDQTRGRAWQGWIELAKYLTAPLSVLDLGCGNGRFGLFLAESLDGQIEYLGLDNNAKLLAYAQEDFKQITHLSAKLIHADLLNSPLPDEKFDLVVLFGVIHHVPSAERRQEFMKALAERVKVGGLFCFAAWRFYEYERFKERLAAWPENLEREENDYLLDWRRGENALRYCHYVDDKEHDALIAATGLEEIARYRADGANNTMNQYSVLRRTVKVTSNE